MPAAAVALAAHDFWVWPPTIYLKVLFPDGKSRTKEILVGYLSPRAGSTPKISIAFLGTLMAVNTTQGSRATLRAEDITSLLQQ